MNRSGNTGVILVIIVALAAAALALRPTTTNTEMLPPVVLPDPGEEPAAGVVITLRQSGGFSLLGFTFDDVTRTGTVQFYAPAGCYEQLTIGDPWPAPFEQCTGPVSTEGTVSGGGIAATGQSIVTVEVEVSEDCYTSLAAGDAWPPATAACSIDIEQASG
jgi:hypothetical protein